MDAIQGVGNSWGLMGNSWGRVGNPWGQVGNSWGRGAKADPPPNEVMVEAVDQGCGAGNCGKEGHIDVKA